MIRKYLSPKNQPVFSHYEFDWNRGIFEEDGVYSYTAKIAAEIVDKTDETIVNAVVDAARRAGVSDLYLLDRDWVLSAIREKMEREERERG